MKTTPKHTASLPFFPGFYESELSALIDWEEENEMENTGKTWEEMLPRLNYAAAHDSLARGWAKRFSAETGLAMEFESLDSPREYNFTTDRVFVVLAPEALEKLESLRGTPELAEVLKEMFTSYSGFHSFYSPDPEDAKWQVPVAEMDHNQLSAYLAAWVLRESGETLRGARKDLCESILEYLSGNGHAGAVWKIVAPVAETV